MTDYQFFRAVCDSPAFLASLKGFGLQATGPFPHRANPAVVICPPDKRWMLSAVEPETICVHIELRKPGTVNVDVELSPYIPFRPSVDIGVAQRTPLLMAKQNLAHDLTLAFRRSQSLTEIGRGYRAAWRPNALMVAKFQAGSDGASPSDYVNSLLPVIEELASIIDRIVPEHRKS